MLIKIYLTLLILLILNISQADTLTKIRKCYNKNVITRTKDNKRKQYSISNYVAESPIIEFYNVVDFIDIANIDTLSDCIKVHYPSHQEHREFNLNLVCI
jgi:hypothetical protein